MGRTKPVAKRRRVDEEDAQQKAIQELLQASPEHVEAAAAQATRQAAQNWPKIEEDEDPSFPAWLRGLGRARNVPVDYLEALKDLHQEIKRKASTWTSWSGSENDPRKRAFGILPGTLGAEAIIQEKLDIATPWKEDVGGKERSRNHRAMVRLEKASSDRYEKAIESLCGLFQKSLPKSSNLQPYLHYKNLIAAQPNLHCGRELLPTHVDHPLKDGFGVIIVTVSVVGSATVLLENHRGIEKRKMRVEEGQAYMLSDQSRNACAHGILADEESPHRESLNLRFGLHDHRNETVLLRKQDAEHGSQVDHPLISSKCVLQFWEGSSSSSTMSQMS